MLILGGTGRVGSLTAAELLGAEPGLDVVLSGRSEASYKKAVEGRPELAAARFLRCDIDSDSDLAAALQGADLVVHTAGCAACWLTKRSCLSPPASRPAPCLAPYLRTSCTSGKSAAVEQWLLALLLLCAASLQSLSTGDFCMHTVCRWRAEAAFAVGPGTREVHWSA